jgi:hypothetical protein
MERFNERVDFRVFKTPCCGHLLCWVNSRFPTYCPTCGKLIFPDIKQQVLTHDDNAMLSWEA